MVGVGQWVRQLAAVVLLAGVTETLLPSGAVRAYARALLSLLVLLLVLRPVVGLSATDVPSLLSAWGGAGGGPTVQATEAAVASGAVRAYEQVLAEAASGLAAAVPGVMEADVRLAYATGQPPTVRAASVWVTPTASGALMPRLASRVRTAVAAGLALPEAAVQVHVS